MKKRQIAQGYLQRAYEALGYKVYDWTTWEQMALYVKDYALGESGEGDENDDMPCPELETQQPTLFHVMSIDRSDIENCGYDTDDLTDEDMANIASLITDGLREGSLNNVIETVMDEYGEEEED